jgi:hypothetical protein
MIRESQRVSLCFGCGSTVAAGLGVQADGEVERLQPRLNKRGGVGHESETLVITAVFTGIQAYTWRVTSVARMPKQPL